MRIGIYTDYAYRRSDAVYGERAFVLFACALRDFFDGVVIFGRLHTEPGTSHYRLREDVQFVGLPYYETLNRPAEALGGLAQSAVRFWRALGELDAVWVIGPYIHSIIFVLLARVRGVPVVLGVRQDLPAYTRNRHPRQRVLHIAADVLEAIWQLFGRRIPVVAVGPDLGRAYRHGREVLPIAISLVRAEDVVDDPGQPDLAARAEIRILCVGRLDAEKNPLLLADILARVREDDPRWRLVVCGDGPLRAELQAELDARGQHGAYEFLGYVPLDGGLIDVYRGADVFLHVSWTEGLPQVLFEAFAAGLPVVATAVGGVEEAVGSAALLIPPGDSEAATGALRRLQADPELAAELVRAGTERVRERTLEREAGRVAAFIAASAGQRQRARRRRRAS